MKMNEIIRSKRLALGLTQEQIADKLGVSGTAVSKWERGAAAPDISLLPAIARLLQTDLNELFSFHEQPSQAEISEFIHTLSPMLAPDCSGFDVLCEHALAKTREYPTCDPLIFNTAALLSAGLLQNSSAHSERYQAEVLTLLHRASESDDPSIRAQANGMLAAQAIRNKNFAHARALIDALPHNVEKQSLEITLLTQQARFDDAETLLQQQLLHSSFDVSNALLQLAQLALEQQNLPRAHILADVLTALMPLLGVWNFSSSALQFQIAVAEQDVQAALHALESISAVLNSTATFHSDTLYSKLSSQAQNTDSQTQNTEILRRQFYYSLQKDDCFDFLRDESQFKEILLTFAPQNS